MNCLKLVKCTVVKRELPPRTASHQLCLSQTSRNVCRYPSLCEVLMKGPEKKSCFDIRKLIIERANPCHSKMIKSFLYSNYWPREPTVTSLWLPLHCPYLQVLTDKYSNSGDRLLAFERMERTNERKLLGVLVANKVFPWMIDEMEDWAHHSCCKSAKSRKYFIAHCYRTPNLFEKYKVPYFYDIEVLGTCPEATGQGVATRLLKCCLDDAFELRHPLAHIIAFNKYVTKICERNKMKFEWSMKYSDFVDHAGISLFYPRRPHHTVSVYTKYNNPKKGGVLPCKPMPA